MPESKPRLLLFMPHIPFPVDRGVYQRIYHLFIELEKAFDIDLVCLQDDEQRSMDPFGPYTRRRLAIPFKHPPWQKLFPDRMVNPLPTTVQHWQDPSVAKALAGFVEGQEYAIIEFIDLVLWPYIKELFPNHPCRVMDRSRVDWLFQAEELNTLQLSWRERFLRKENLRKIARLEREAYAELSGMIVCGLDDRTFLSKHLSYTKPIFVLPNGYNEQFFNPEEFPRMLTDHPTVLFCGALDYSPNVDAINWFADEIWPLIRARQPEVEWLLIGKSPDERAERWRKLDGVNLIGEVPDVRPYYQKSWLQVVPLRIGGGTRLKIVESLGMHTPVVSTTLGAQGLDLVDGEDIVLADTPTAFADSVLDMLNSNNRRIAMEQQGARTVNENYRWEQLGVKLNHYLENL